MIWIYCVQTIKKANIFPKLSNNEKSTNIEIKTVREGTIDEIIDKKIIWFLTEKISLNFPMKVVFFLISKNWGISEIKVTNIVINDNDVYWMNIKNVLIYPAYGKIYLVKNFVSEKAIFWVFE